MLVIGLTGSIAMGKSTTAAMFRARGVAVHDADAAVHRLYAGAAVAPIEAAFPGAASAGKVDRQFLATILAADPGALARLEAIVHPMVREVEAAFLAAARARGHRRVVLDIPLLFETAVTSTVAVVAVVSASAEVQRARVLARQGMTEEKFQALLNRQLPDAEKRRRAHFVIATDRGIAAADRQVAALLRALAGVC